MNIAYVASAKIPSREANSIHVMKMCSAFASEGHNVTLFVPMSTEIEPDIEDDFEYYGVPHNFNIKKVRLFLPFISIWKNNMHSFSVAMLIKKSKFDFVYGRDFYTCFVAAQVFRIPVLFEAHTPSVSTKFRSLIRSKRFLGLVVITEALKQIFVSQYNIDEEKIYVAPDGADELPDAVTPARLIGKSVGMFNVGYIGQLYRGRGIELIGEIAERCPFAFFHIIGGFQEDIHMHKENLGYIRNINFYGYIPHSQTASYGVCMDVLVAPYQKEVYTTGVTKSSPSTVKWMSPLKVFEYMSFGKPIVCSDISVLREILENGINCIMCPPEDVGAWCDAIKTLYENQTFAKAIAKNASAGFIKYTWRQRARNIVQQLMEYRYGDK